MKNLTDYIKLVKVDVSDILQMVLHIPEDMWKTAKVNNDSPMLDTHVRDTDEFNIEQDHPLDGPSFNLLQKHVSNYCNEFGLSVSIDDGYRILRYNVGQKYVTHYDTSFKQQRDLSVVLLLNDDYEGGELVFPELGITVNPKEHNLILFPSYFMYKHEVKPVISGTRYSLVTWLH